MMNKKVLISVLMMVILLITSAGVGFAADTDNFNKNHNQTGEFRYLQAGDEFVYRVIPAGQEKPVEAYYYERVTDKTYVTPGGQNVKLIAIGDVGKDPSVNICFTQDADRVLNFYGVLVPNPVVPDNYVYQEWVTKPESGFVLNYQGTYFVGAEWKQTYDTTNMFGAPATTVDLSFKIVGLEQVTVTGGKFKAFRIECFESDGKLNSITWFAPELGINVKKISYDMTKTGYELSDCCFADLVKNNKYK